MQVISVMGRAYQRIYLRFYQHNCICNVQNQCLYCYSLQNHVIYLIDLKVRYRFVKIRYNFEFTLFQSLIICKIKQKYHTVGTVIKCNREFVETELASLQKQTQHHYRNRPSITIETDLASLQKQTQHHYINRPSITIETDRASQQKQTQHHNRNRPSITIHNCLLSWLGTTTLAE